MKKALAVLVVVLLVGCSLLQPSLKDSLVGTWIQDSDHSYSITFSKNGTMSNSLNKSGTWTLNDDRLLLSWSGGSSAVVDITINKDTLIMDAGLLQISFTRQ